MTFIQLRFMVFLAVSFILFYVCPVKHRWKVLLAVSIVFYGIAGVKYFPFIFITSFSVFLTGRKIGHIYAALDKNIAESEGLDRKAKKAMREAAKKHAKKFLIACLVFNIVILCYSKYTKFLINPINDFLAMLGSGAQFSAAMIIVPLGISYYTFSSLSYLLDVFWKKIDYETNYARFLLYAIYFPHILQGPIERYGRLGVRLKQELRFDSKRCAYGLQLMLWGFFKKLVIADRANVFIQSVYGNYLGSDGGVLFIITALLDVVYIYADFSGCMDIARGASDLFGVELDLNFNHPFCSKSVVELWRRWHMSLGSWFKDYVYYPVSTSHFVKNLNKTLRGKLPNRVTRVVVTAVPVTITWVLTGTWHGNGIGYVCWGVYYAFMILMSVSFAEDFTRFGQKYLHINEEATSWKAIQAIRTTFIFAGGRLLTTPGSIGATWYIVRNTLITFNPWILFDGSLLNYGLDRMNIIVLISAIIIFGVISRLQIAGEKDGVRVRDRIARQNLVVRWMIYFAAIFSIIILGIYGPGYDASSFVYMAF